MEQRLDDLFCAIPRVNEDHEVITYLTQAPTKGLSLNGLEPKDAYDPLVKPSKKRFHKVT